MKIEAHVIGEPKGQPRPKAYRRGNRAAVYDPGTANGWKLAVAGALRDLLPDEPYAGPVAVSAKFILPRPKRLMRKKDPEGELLHTSKPDSDNLLKAVMDVCSDIQLWRDDTQVVDVFVQKRYAAKNGRPGMHLIIESIAIGGRNSRT